MLTKDHGLVATMFALLLACAAPAPAPPASPPATGGTRGAGTGGAGGAATPPASGGATGVDAEAGRPDTMPVDVAPESPPARSDARDLASDPPDEAPNSGVYQPCPPAGACAVLPLGDSLTQGAGSSGGGYRRELFRQVVAHGQAVTFVGSRASGPAMLEGVKVPFPRNHEGHGGFTIQNLAAWIGDNATIATYKPHVVLLGIGVNNGLRRTGADVPAALRALGSLLDQILAVDGKLLLIVAQITPSSTAEGRKNVAAYNAGIPALVAARVAAGKHVVIAEVHQAFVANPNWPTAYLPDSDVHPNDAGYDAMGRGWYAALAPWLRE